MTVPIRPEAEAAPENSIHDHYGRGWKVLSKFRAFLLWFGGFHLGTSLLFMLYYVSEGEPTQKLLSPGLSAIVAIIFVWQALYGAPNADSTDRES